MNKDNPKLDNTGEKSLVDHPVVDFEWLKDSTADGEGPSGQFCSATMLRKATGIAYTTSMFLRMEAAGHGPFAAGADLRRECNFMQWHTGVFGEQGSGIRASVVRRPPEAAPFASGKPVWMLASNRGPDTDFLSDHLVAWGADVLLVETPLDAARIASSQNGLAGAVLDLGNVQAEFVTAHILMQRGIGFLIVAYGGERPTEMALGGAMICNPRSMAEIRAALGSLPERHIRGLDLNVRSSIQWNRSTPLPE